MKEKKAVKSIVFDIGEVLDKGRSSQHWKLLCDNLNINLDKFDAIRKINSEKIREGKINFKDYILKIISLI